MEDLLKRPCAFLMKIVNPLETSALILDTLSERGINVNTANLHNISREEGILIIHCMIETDRARSMRGFLEKLKGITELEYLHSRSSNLVKVSDI
jgi:hypothetical protein